MNIVFLFYEGMTALDAIGPYEVLWRLPGVSICSVAMQSGPIRTNSGLILNADHALSEISKADVLVVPGAGNATTLRDMPDTLAWVRKIHTTTSWTASVCTGSLVLAAAGILNGLGATSHWAVIDRLQTLGAIPVHKRVVEDGKVITAAGVSAGIDMALTLAAKIAGVQEAEAVQLTIEYDPEPPFDAGSVDKAEPAMREMLRARMLSKFEPLGDL